MMTSNERFTLLRLLRGDTYTGVWDMNMNYIGGKVAIVTNRQTQTRRAFIRGADYGWLNITVAEARRLLHAGHCTRVNLT
jgi:hypothetical protein